MNHHSASLQVFEGVNGRFKNFRGMDGVTGHLVDLTEDGAGSHATLQEKQTVSHGENIMVVY